MIRFTDEQARLYAEFREAEPWIETLELLAVAIHVYQGRRLLCLEVRPPGARSSGFAHWHRGGFVAEDMEEITKEHKLDAYTSIRTARR